MDKKYTKKIIRRYNGNTKEMQRNQMEFKGNAMQNTKETQRTNKGNTKEMQRKHKSSANEIQTKCKGNTGNAKQI